MATIKYKKSKKAKKTLKRLKNKNFKKLNCSPKSEFKFTCYNTNTILQLKKAWNDKNNTNKINSNKPKKIWQTLKNNYKDVCNDELCWLEKLQLKNKINTKKLFAPSAPKSWDSNPTEWLSSIDILNVLKQFEKKYPTFKFLGPSPIDFDKKKSFNQCVWNTLCKFNLKNYINKGYNKIGIIFNTDPHYLGGSHWICVFIDIEKNFIYYFDSTADTIPHEIKKFIEKVKLQGNSLNIKLKFLENKTQHQLGDTECGIYVLVVLILLLKNKWEPKDFKKRIPDKKMIEVRDVLFN